MIAAFSRLLDVLRPGRRRRRPGDTKEPAAIVRLARDLFDPDVESMLARRASAKLVRDEIRRRGVFWP
jgi:hypothetical protein